MNRLFENTQQTVASHMYLITKNLFGLLAAGMIMGTVACSGPDQATVELTVDPVLGQAVFALPEEAANAFVLAVASDDVEMLGQVLGADYREVLPLNEVDGKDVDNFIAAAEKHTALLPRGDKKRLLAVGKNEWTLPIPIVEGTSGWYFDIKKGLEFFNKSVSTCANDATTPIYLKKMGLAYEADGNTSAALDAYEKIKRDYKSSTEGRTIDKYIGKLEAQN